MWRTSLAVGCMLGSCCYYASDAEARKLCTDSELRKIIESTPEYETRRLKMQAWADTNLRSEVAKQQMNVLMGGSLSLSDRVRILDEFARDHGMDRCENVHVKVP
jgi:hypothetical protein